MDREQLRSQAASRRNHAATEPSRKAIWHCKFCEHDFVSEMVFMKHRCKEKIRHEELRSPIGQAAYQYYSLWMKAQKHSVPPIDTFAESKFYSTFIKFAEHTKKVHIPSVEQFIRLMVENGKVPPGLWCRDNVYSMYMKAYDAAVPPLDQFMNSLQLLEELALELKVPLSEVYQAIGIDTLEDLIKKRKLSHWFLLASSKFRAFMLSLPSEEKDRLSDAMNSGAAVARIQQEPNLFKEFGKATAEVGL